MKILQINAAYGMGSTGYYTKLLHEKLLKDGHESYVAATLIDESDNTDKRIFKVGNFFSRKISSLKSRITGQQNDTAGKTTKDLIAFIEKIRPDIIQLGNLHANFVSLKKLIEYISQKNIAVVVVLHDCWFFTGKCTNYVDAGCMKWKQHCGECPKLRADIPSWFCDKTGAMLKEKKEMFDKVRKLTVVGVSEKITEDAKKSYVFGGRNCICIPNAIDDKIFYPKVASDDVIPLSYRTVIGVASDWSEYKGASDFIRLGKLCKAHFGDSVRVRLVGSLDGLSKKTLLLLKEAGVELLGRKTQHEIADLYRASDVYVSLSQGESFGCSISEAIMCGLPVVSYQGYAEGGILEKSCGKYIVREHGNIKKVFEYVSEILSVEKSESTKYCMAENYSPLGIEEYYNRYLKNYELFC